MRRREFITLVGSARRSRTDLTDRASRPLAPSSGAKAGFDEVRGGPQKQREKTLYHGIVSRIDIGGCAERCKI
jgi:hypothetical protein